MLGRMHVIANELPKARNMFERGLEVDPGNVDFKAAIAGLRLMPSIPSPRAAATWEKGCRERVWRYLAEPGCCAFAVFDGSVRNRSDGSRTALLALAGTARSPQEASIHVAPGHRSARQVDQGRRRHLEIVEVRAAQRVCDLVSSGSPRVLQPGHQHEVGVETLPDFAEVLPETPLSTEYSLGVERLARGLRRNLGERADGPPRKLGYTRGTVAPSSWKLCPRFPITQRSISGFSLSAIVVAQVPSGFGIGPQSKLIGIRVRGRTRRSAPERRSRSGRASERQAVRRPRRRAAPPGAMAARSSVLRCRRARSTPAAVLLGALRGDRQRRLGAGRERAQRGAPRQGRTACPARRPRSSDRGGACRRRASPRRRRRRGRRGGRGRAGRSRRRLPAPGRPRLR